MINNKLFIFFIILSISAAGAQAALNYDLNGDGTVDNGDLVIIQQHFNEVTSQPYTLYDVNADGVVDIQDATLVGQHIGENVSDNISSPSSLLANPGFESGTSSPLNWTFVTNNGSTPVWDANVSHSGARSVKIQLTGTQDNKSGYPRSDLIRLLPNTNYNFSAWGMTEGAGGTNAPAVRLVELDANLKVIRQTTIGFSKGSNAWVQKSILINTTSNTSFAYVYANIWNGYGTFRVDDVEVRGVAEVTTIAILFSTAYLVAYQTQQFTAIGYDAKGNTVNITPKWNSSNTTVGTIDLLGLFTALNPGMTTITATSDTVSANATITVTSAGSKIPTNLVSNPGFENGTTSPLNWSLITNNGNAPLWDSNTYHTGAHSIRIQIQGTVTNNTSGYPRSNLIPLLPNTTYNLSAWGMTEGAGGTNGPALRVVELDTDLNLLRETSLIFANGTNPWTQKSLRLQTGSDTGFAYLYADIRDGYGTLWIDDVELSGIENGIYGRKNNYYIVNSNGTFKALNGTNWKADFSGPTAIQDAIDSLTLGGIVQFDSGTFKTNIKILKNNIILQGSGQNTILELANGKERAIFSINTNNITIRNFTINGRNDITTLSSIQFYNITDLKIENNQFINSYLRAIDVYPEWNKGVNINKNVYILNNTFTNNTRDAIYVSASNVLIQGNIIDDSPDTAIDTGELISNVNITNNIINSAHTGILLSNYYGNGQVSNNILRNITANGISVSDGNSTNHLIKNNIVSSSSIGYSAIKLSNTSNIQIINNSLDGFATNQIRCNNGNNIYISRNVHLHPNGNYAIYSSCSNLIVEMDIFYLGIAQGGIFSKKPLIAVNNIFSNPDGSILLEVNSQNSIIANNLHFDSRNGIILNNSGNNYILNNQFINSVYKEDIFEQSDAGSNIFKNNSFKNNVINITIENFHNINEGNNSVISQNYKYQPLYWGIRTTQKSPIGNGEIYFNSTSISLCYSDTLINNWRYYDNNSVGC